MNFVDKVLGISPQVLAARSQRSELIAANLANADTPGFKSRDIDFASMFAAAGSEQQSLKKTNAMHMGLVGLDGDIKYRIPSQPSLDGNTVETDVEYSAFMDNAIRYQASLNFLDGRIKSMLSALKGE